MIICRYVFFLSQFMLSKCANPVCGAQFRYLNIGKVFAAEYRPASEAGSEFVQVQRNLRCFWLCPTCSQLMTVQGSGAGGVRLAAKNLGNEGPSATPPPQILITGRGCDMARPELRLEALRQELAFLDNGGYRQKMGWRAPLVFEDSPICPKTPKSVCPDPRCLLWDLVPPEHRQEVIPCRHIPLNEAGETLTTLYNTGNMEEIEIALRAWLQKEIAELKQIVSPELPGPQKTAA
jgi:hypothetical protein